MKIDRRIDFVVSLPGPAEALIPVITELRKSVACRVIGLSSHPRYDRIGGSLRVFRRAFPEALDLAEWVGSGEAPLERLVRDPANLLVLGAVDDPDNQLRFPEKDVLALCEEVDVTTVQYIDNWFAWPTATRRADHLFVIDSFAARIGRHFCAGATSFFETGHTGLQELLRTAVRRAPVSRARGPICYFTQLNVATVRTLGWLDQALAAEDTLIIKKHPRDSMEYEGELARFDCRAAVVNDSPEALFSTIGQTITHTSVVGLKSAMLSIPTVNVTPRDFMPEVYDLIGGYPPSIAGFSEEVRSSSELREAVRNPRVADPRAVIDHFHAQDATERFHSRIIELL